jgi:pimeloyl-ACP methyl ester carboxylesterase
MRERQADRSPWCPSVTAGCAPRSAPAPAAARRSSCATASAPPRGARAVHQRPRSRDRGGAVRRARSEELLARLAAEMLGELGYDRFDAFGISWGGGLAQLLALQYPRRCRRLVLAATSTGSLMIPASPLVLRTCHQAAGADPGGPRRPDHPTGQRQADGRAAARRPAARLPGRSPGPAHQGRRARPVVSDFLLSVEPGARRAVE